MKIVRFTAENVKRLKAVEITPDGQLVVIGGMNAQGKTSVLDAIEMALGGKESVVREPIRRGQTSARVVLELDDEYGLRIERRFTKKGSTLNITTADGRTPTSPQTLLDSICNRIAFDPLQFIRQPAKSQAAALRKLVGLDFEQLDQQRAALYETRTGVNRDAKRERAAADAIKVTTAATDPVDVTALVSELKLREAANREIDQRESKLEVAKHGLSVLKDTHARMVEQIKGLQAKLAELQDTIDRSTEWIKTETDTLAGIVRQDTDGIEQEIAESETTNAAVRQATVRRQHLVAAREAEREAEELTRQIDAIDAQKSESLAAAKWPVAGLGFDGDGVNFNGLPIEQSSSAEQTRVAVAIGLALNPELPVVLIRDGSLLDEDSLAAVAIQAAEHGAQIWVERVGKGHECSVVIEDGEVVASK